MTLRPVTLFSVIVSMVTGIALGVTAHVVLHRDDAPANKAQALGFVIDRIRDSYVESVDEGQLTEDAIRGMLKGLDEHSRYLDGDQFSELEAQTSGHFGGVGIEIGLVDGYITVLTPMDKTPADRAGIAAGDVLLKLDDTPMKGTSLTDAAKLLRGAPGTSLELQVRRGDNPEPLRFHLVRTTIEVNSVGSRLLEPGIGYLRIVQFQATTGNDLKRALDKLSQPAPLKGLILDLRNNPGGVLKASVDVADTFLTEGTIVYTQARRPSSQLNEVAAGKDRLDGAPIVVLINRGSASASEIVAGALQDHHRAVIMGSHSYGKGTVQTVMPLKNHHAIKLTTARYFTPSGRSIQDTGIQPDIVMEGVDDRTLLEEAVLALKAEPTVHQEPHSISG